MMPEESGIPDFRSPGGLWTRYNPRQLGFLRYLADPGTAVQAKRLGAYLLIVNREPTPLDDLADAVLNGEAGTLLPALVDKSLAGAVPDPPGGYP